MPTFNYENYIMPGYTMKPARIEHIDKLKEGYRQNPPVFKPKDMVRLLKEYREHAFIDINSMLLSKDYLLQQAAHLYYNDPENSVVPDAIFDEAKRELTKTYSLQPHLKPEVSIVDMVGSPVMSGGLFEKYPHKFPMLSLGNVFSEDEFTKWYTGIQTKLNRKDVPLCMEYKFDGLAIELVYQAGDLVLAGTRGDGVDGDDITENVRQITEVPKTLLTGTVPIEDTLYVYGEAMCSVSGFNLYNQTAKKPLANPRNGAAGSLRLTDSEEVKARPLIFSPYGVRHMQQGIESDHNTDMLTLEGLGFAIELPLYTGNDISAIMQTYTKAFENRAQEDFEYDGVVIKVMLDSDRTRLGYNDCRDGKKFSTTVPVWAIAFKFPAVTVLTTLLSVDFQVGRFGTITPVAKVTPVQVGGVTVSSITMHNRDELMRMKFRINDVLSIYRAGEVVPQIMGIHNESEEGPLVTYPDYCPCCHGPLTKEGAMTYCGNYNCDAQTTRRLEHFVSRDAFNMVGLATGVINDLYYNNLVHDVVDLFKLTKEDLLKLDGWKETKATKVLDAIEASKHISLANFIYSLGCNSAGESTSNRIANEIYKVEGLKTLDYNGLIKIDKIGAVMASEIVEYFDKEEIQAIIDKLLALGVKVQEVNYVMPSTDGKYNGKRFCITGSFNNYTRGSLRELILLHDGIVVDSVNKTTDYLLCGDKPGSKLTKALSNKLTQVIYEEDIAALF